MKNVKIILSVICISLISFTLYAQVDPDPEPGLPAKDEWGNHLGDVNVDEIYTNAKGDIIHIVCSKEMAKPNATDKGKFSVNVGGGNIPIKSISLDINTWIINLELTRRIIEGEVVSHFPSRVTPLIFAGNNEPGSKNKF